MTAAASLGAARGVVLAAPGSGHGKTTVTLALLRAYRERGLAVGSVKVGPDYIDPAFHAAASGRPCLNADLWGMRAATVAAVLARACAGVELVLAEGVMGLFDGAADDTGSTADFAARTGWPVLLVVDASGMAASVAALVTGFAGFRSDVRVAGVVFNRIGSAAHEALLRRACERLDVTVLGALRRRDDLVVPDRHLGLVQAAEHPALEHFMATAATAIAASVDLDALAGLAQPCRLLAWPAVGRRRNAGNRDSSDLAAPGSMPTDAPQLDPAPSGLPPIGQRIAVAADQAFAFAYPLLLDGWRDAGAEIHPFSPLADEPPDPRADAVYLPGGYPELHAGRLAGARRFMAGLREAAARGAFVYGECGGFMALGRSLTDAHGAVHPMADLLPVDTSFESPRLTLGYRDAVLLAPCPLGPAGQRLRGHEFHFAHVLRNDTGEPLLRCRSAGGRALGETGARAGSVVGSFVHLLDLVG